MTWKLISCGGNDPLNVCEHSECEGRAHNYTVGGYDRSGYFTACREHAQDCAEAFVDEAIRTMAAEYKAGA